MLRKKDSLRHRIQDSDVTMVTLRKLLSDTEFRQLEMIQFCDVWLHVLSCPRRLHSSNIPIQLERSELDTIHGKSPVQIQIELVCFGMWRCRHY